MQLCCKNDLKMILNYKTEKLPFNFISLGLMLCAIGVWRMIVLDWKGILFFIISILLLFIKSGVVIDTDKRRIKKYIGLLMIIKGEWEDVNSVVNIEIINTRESQTMSTLSISRTETNDVYKLYMNLPDRNIELMSGKEGYICDRAKKIASLLKTSVVNSAN